MRLPLVVWGPGDPSTCPHSPTLRVGGRHSPGPRSHYIPRQTHRHRNNGGKSPTSRLPCSSGLSPACLQQKGNPEAQQGCKRSLKFFFKRYFTGGDAWKPVRPSGKCGHSRLTNCSAVEGRPAISEDLELHLYRGRGAGGRGKLISEPGAESSFPSSASWNRPGLTRERPEPLSWALGQHLPNFSERNLRAHVCPPPRCQGFWSRNHLR